MDNIAQGWLIVDGHEVGGDGIVEGDFFGCEPQFLGALIIAEGLYVLQGVLGVALWVGGNSVNVSRMTMHVLYGVFAVVFLPFLFTYQRGDDSNRAQWVYALGLLFLFGIALRAGYTGT